MKRIRIFLLLAFTVLSLGMMAQTGINSPYSRYGLGQLNYENVNTVSVSMGGLGIALHDPTTLNPANPASYGSLDSSSFLFELGVNANFTTMKTTTQSENGYDATLSYIFAGFPITDWWRSGIGIMPFSKIGYNIEFTTPIEDFSDVVQSFEGSGGLNKVFWGNGFNITNNLRLGIDVNYVFGQSSRNHMVYFPDSILIFGTKVENTIQLSAFVLNYGLQYDFKVSPKTEATVGLTYSQRTNSNSKYTYLSKTLWGGYNDIVEDVKDTIVYDPDGKGTIVIPPSIGIGFALLNEGSWMIGADFEWQKWKDFEAFGEQDSLNNSWRVTLGGQFTPKHTTISSLFRRMTYRAGIRYEQSYLEFYDQNINEFGISFGVGFPFRNSKTGIDIAMEMGRIGTTKKNLIQENFFNFAVGISIQEHWFQKRKYR